MERTGKIFVNYLETTSNWNGQYPQTIVALPQWFDFLLPTRQYTITGSGRSLGEGNGNTLQYSCLGNPMDRGAWWATFHGVTRVGHDSMTKPPPDTIQGKCFTYVNCLWESVGFFFLLNPDFLTISSKHTGVPAWKNQNHGQRKVLAGQAWFLLWL